MAEPEKKDDKKEKKKKSFLAVVGGVMLLICGFLLILTIGLSVATPLMQTTGDAGGAFFSETGNSFSKWAVGLLKAKSGFTMFLGALFSIVAMIILATLLGRWIGSLFKKKDAPAPAAAH